MRKSMILLAVSALALGGCAFKPQLREVVIDHNELVAETEDQLTLLNIVRAKERFPMHFTTITALRGGATLTGGAELGLAFPADGGKDVFGSTGALTSREATIGADTVSPKLTGSISTNPSFDIAVLNNDKFQRGIQQPIRTELIEYFLQQGWRDDLLMALFIEKIDLVASEDQGKYRKGDTVFSLVNGNPPETGYMGTGGENSRAFRCFIRSHRMVPRKKGKKIDDLVALQDVTANSSIQDLALLDGKLFDIGKNATSGLYMIHRITAGGVALGFVKREASPIDVLSDECATRDTSPENKALFSGETSLTFLEAPAGGGEQSVDAESGIFKKDGTDYKVDVVPVLRSPQSIIYFLGEYSRTNLDNRYRLINGRRVFTLLNGSGDAAVAANFRGERYFVTDDEGDDDGQSLQLLDLVQQLLNLQKTSEELPASRSVTVVRE